MTDASRLLGLSPDPGDYRSEPPTRWVQPMSPRSVTVLTVAGALLVGFMLAVGVTAGRSAVRTQDVRKAQLIELIEARQEQVAALGEQLEDLRSRVSEHQGEASASGLQAQLERTEQAAGLTPLAGPGLRLRLDDAGSSCRGAQPQDCRIQDVDLQLAVNALLASGAEAVAVNGERVIATTAIRSAGQAILVNYRVLTPPYVVEAVGDAAALARNFASSDFAGDFEVWQSRYGLGFSWEEAEELLLPPYSGSLQFRRARVADEVSDRT